MCARVRACVCVCVAVWLKCAWSGAERVSNFFVQFHTLNGQILSAERVVNRFPELSEWWTDSVSSADGEYILLAERMVERFSQLSGVWINSLS